MSIVSITLNLKAEVGDCFCIQSNGMCYWSTALYCTPVTNCYFIMRLNLTLFMVWLLLLYQLYCQS